MFRLCCDNRSPAEYADVISLLKICIARPPHSSAAVFCNHHRVPSSTVRTPTTPSLPPQVMFKRQPGKDSSRVSPARDVKPPPAAFAGYRLQQPDSVDSRGARSAGRPSAEPLLERRSAARTAAAAAPPASVPAPAPAPRPAPAIPAPAPAQRTPPGEGGRRN